MTTLALWLLPIATAACWRWSRLVASALGAALGAWLLYRYAWQWEGLRWVSAVTGTMGLFEVVTRWSVRSPLRRHLRITVDGPLPGFEARAVRNDIIRRASAEEDELRKRVQRSDILAILLVWSALADALSLLWWRKTEQWGALPALQVITLVVMITIGAWPRRKHA